MVTVTWMIWPAVALTGKGEVGIWVEVKIAGLSESVDVNVTLPAHPFGARSPLRSPEDPVKLSLFAPAPKLVASWLDADAHRGSIVCTALMEVRPLGTVKFPDSTHLTLGLKYTTVFKTFCDGDTIAVMLNKMKVLVIGLVAVVIM